VVLGTTTNRGPAKWAKTPGERHQRRGHVVLDSGECERFGLTPIGESGTHPAGELGAHRAGEQELSLGETGTQAPGDSGTNTRGNAYADSEQHHDFP
jgi:hypothetical protein